MERLPWRTGFCPNELAEGGGRLVQNGDPFPGKQLVKISWRAACQVRHHHQLSSVEQGAPHFPDGKIEGMRMKQGPAVLRVKLEPGFRLLEKAQHILV